MRNFKHFILLAASILLNCTYAYGEVVVVVSAKSGVEQLTQDEVMNIFLGRHRKFSTGIAAVPVDQPTSTGLRAEFYHKLVDKALAEINAYWARLYFSGKTTPPLQAKTTSQVIAHIVDNPGGIGYLERDQVDSRMRVVLTLSP
jgi:ABC-type phosphate transport system substrate-binding protein